jgi:hypothetical protein
VQTERCDIQSVGGDEPSQRRVNASTVIGENMTQQNDKPVVVHIDVQTLKPEPETNSLPFKLEETDRASRGGCLQRGLDTWTSYSVIRMKVTDQEIEQIVDCIHCPWMVPSATSISLFGSREMCD